MSISKLPEGSSEDGLRNLSSNCRRGCSKTRPHRPDYCEHQRIHNSRAIARWETSLSGESCPDNTQVGTITVRSVGSRGPERTFGLFNLAPDRRARRARRQPLRQTDRLRALDPPGRGRIRHHPEGDGRPARICSVSGLTVTIWGVPWSVIHNEQRGNCLNELEPGIRLGQMLGRAARKDPNPKPRAYLTLPTSCEEPLDFAALADPGSRQPELARARSGQAPAGRLRETRIRAARHGPAQQPARLLALRLRLRHRGRHQRRRRPGLHPRTFFAPAAPRRRCARPWSPCPKG